MYLVWAYTPAAVLAAHGITYYPSKHWAVAIPSWVCVTVVFAYWVYERCELQTQCVADCAAHFDGQPSRPRPSPACVCVFPTRDVGPRQVPG